MQGLFFVYCAPIYYVLIDFIKLKDSQPMENQEGTLDTEVFLPP